MGLLATMVGVLVFLLLLLVAVQVLFNLYATSAVSAAAYDGARLAAGYDGAHDPRGREKAADHVVRLLGSYGRSRVRLRWQDEPGVEVLTVTAKNPSFLPSALRAPLGFDEIHRTVRVRVEREIEP